MNEGQRLIVESLTKAYAEACARVQGLGMSNVYGLSEVEKAQLDIAYGEALQSLQETRAALHDYLKRRACKACSLPNWDVYHTPNNPCPKQKEN